MPRIEPFDGSDVGRGADGRLQYTNLPTTVTDMLGGTVARTPDAEALVELGAGRLTYRQLWDAASKVAGGLREAGVSTHDRVALRLPNGIDWCLAFFGALLAGAVVVPINTRLKDHEVEYIVQDSSAVLTLDTARTLPRGKPYACDTVSADDLAAIFYTSGTTGFPKGAMTSHANILANNENCLRIIGIKGANGEEVRNLVSTPLFHVTGSSTQLLPTCQIGGTTIIMPTFNVQTFLRTIEDERITQLVTVPAIYWLALHQPNFYEIKTSSIRWLSYGGAPTSPDLVTRIREGFSHAALGNGFGLTETSSAVSYLPNDYCLSRPETVGFAVPVVDLKLDDERDGVGELIIRGQNVVAGYWGNRAATQDAFRDHWFYTGDLARIDADGFVEIVDRKKDMINRGGENVYSVEVENVLMQHPDVFEVAVIGVPDAMMGQKVGAVVVPRAGVELKASELIDFAAERLADFKVPQYVCFWTDPLPRNPNGKVLKPQLKAEVSWS
jgi:long-chain acyl-CoA synthetase